MVREEIKIAVEAMRDLCPNCQCNDNNVGECMRDVISECSDSARALCYGQSDEFCLGVLLTLRLNRNGKLPSNVLDVQL